jgi:D-amino-acid dehydrogenase
MACGSAQILADLMAKQKTAIQSDDLGLGRYSGSRYN